MNIITPNNHLRYALETLVATKYRPEKKFGHELVLIELSGIKELYLMTFILNQLTQLKKSEEYQVIILTRCETLLSQTSFDRFMLSLNMCPDSLLNRLEARVEYSGNLYELSTQLLALKRIHRLTNVELETTNFMLSGDTPQDIARKKQICIKTVYSRFQSLKMKTGIKSLPPLYLYFNEINAQIQNFYRARNRTPLV